jgi:hypothetical protein
MEYNPPATGRMSQLPQDYLQPLAGNTDMTMTVTVQDAMNMGEMICVYWASFSGYVFWFGIQLYQPINVGHAGYSPYYAICSGRVAQVSEIPQLRMESIWFGTGQDLWKRPVPDQSQSYYFTTADDQLPEHLKIGLVPTAGGEDFGLMIQISDVS